MLSNFKIFISNFKMKLGTRPVNRIKLDREYDQIFLIAFLTKNSRATESASLFDILSGHYFFKIFNIPSNLLLKPDLENLRAFRKLFFEEKKSNLYRLLYFSLKLRMEK